MLETIRLKNKVIEVGSVEALPKFPETFAYYYVNTATPSWWRWHDGMYREYEPSMLPGAPYLVPRLVNLAKYEVYGDLPKRGCVGTRYDLENGASYFWDYATGKYVQINAEFGAHVGIITFPTVALAGPLHTEGKLVYQGKTETKMALLGWRLDWPIGIDSIGQDRFIGADAWERKDRKVALGAVATELYGDANKKPSSGPEEWPEIVAFV